MTSLAAVLESFSMISAGAYKTKMAICHLCALVAFNFSLFTLCKKHPDAAIELVEFTKDLKAWHLFGERNGLSISYNYYRYY
jgi:hypothetical protein